MLYSTVPPDILWACTHLPFLTGLGKVVCAMRGDTMLPVDSPPYHMLELDLPIV